MKRRMEPSDREPRPAGKPRTGLHTLVLGGGIVGISTAYWLARRGERVTLLERESIGEGASAGNAGIIAPGHPPLPTPGLPWITPSLLLDRAGPLYIAPRLDAELLRWLVTFLRACGETHYARSLEILAGIGPEAVICLRGIVETERLDCEHNPTGWLEVFRSGKALDRGRRTADRLRRLGFRIDELVGGALREREPAYREEVAGALHHVDGGFANPRLFLHGLARSANAHGATLRTGEEVLRIELDGDRFAALELRGGDRVVGDRLVLAAGAWTTKLARSIGISVPMQAGKGYHANLHGVRRRPGTTAVLAETFVAVTPLDGGLRLAGTVELSGVNLRVDSGRLGRLRSGARTYLHGIDNARVVSTWCGLRPMTADGLPIVGWAPRVRDVFVASGHAMMGFLLGPLTGRLVAEALIDGAPSIDIRAFDPVRFR